jgi:hypothetical protein
MNNSSVSSTSFIVARVLPTLQESNWYSSIKANAYGGFEVNHRAIGAATERQAEQAKKRKSSAG